MPLNSYQKICYKYFGDIGERVVKDELKKKLEEAHSEIRPAAYLAYTWVNTILAAVVSTFVYITLIIFLQLDLVLSTMLAIIPVATTVIVYVGFIKMPDMKAKNRAKKIDLNLSYALNFISAMSSAGVTPTEIFKSLSKQKIYGEIREEALSIYRDVSLLGRDIISAIKANIERTPSDKFKEFLQGAVITVQSGGALKPYFMEKSKQYTRENRVLQRQMIENLGIMAEAYVTAAVAGILLIIVIVPILMVISGGGKGQLILMYILSFLVIPIIHVMFAIVLSFMSEEV